MMGDSEQKTRGEFKGSRLLVYGTNPDDPYAGRIFVWTKTGWFERIEGESGDVAFTPIAYSEDELKEIISEDNPSADLVALSRSQRRLISEEFIAQSISFDDYLVDGGDEPFNDDDNQTYHQHDL